MLAKRKRVILSIYVLDNHVLELIIWFIILEILIRLLEKIIWNEYIMLNIILDIYTLEYNSNIHEVYAYMCLVIHFTLNIEKLIETHNMLITHILKVLSSSKRERLLILWLILMIIKLWVIMILIMCFKVGCRIFQVSKMKNLS